MRRILLVLFVVFVAASLAMAINSNYQSTVDVQGAHNNHGRGCTGCHVPHSGPRGNGNAAGGITGSHALWGQSPGTLMGTFLQFGDGGKWVEQLPATDYSDSGYNPPDLTGLLYCLTCHEGNSAKGAMMTGIVDWASEGITPGALGYASGNVPTWLGNDGSGAVLPYSNDHPVGLNALVGCNVSGAAGWNDCTTTVANNKITFNMTGAQSGPFRLNYGWTISPSWAPTAPAGTGVVVCTTCHNQHVMTVYNGTIANVKGYYQTQFGIKGYYNPTGGNSTSQFCRQCHQSHANEYNNAMNIPTT